jgi:hypothetical protein
MKKTRKPAKPVSADAIARLADRGKDVSSFFKGEGRMVQVDSPSKVSLRSGTKRDDSGPDR